MPIDILLMQLEKVFREIEEDMFYSDQPTYIHTKAGLPGF